MTDRAEADQTAERRTRLQCLILHGEAGLIHHAEEHLRPRHGMAVGIGDRHGHIYRLAGQGFMDGGIHRHGELIQPRKVVRHIARQGSHIRPPIADHRGNPRIGDPISRKGNGGGIVLRHADVGDAVGGHDHKQRAVFVGQILSIVIYREPGSFIGNICARWVRGHGAILADGVQLVPIAVNRGIFVFIIGGGGVPLKGAHAVVVGDLVLVMGSRDGILHIRQDDHPVRKGFREGAEHFFPGFVAVGGLILLGDGIVIGPSRHLHRPAAAERHGNAALGGITLQLFPHGIVGRHIRQGGGVQMMKGQMDPILLPGGIPHIIAVEIEEAALGIQAAPLVPDQFKIDIAVGGIGGVGPQTALPQGDGGRAVFVGHHFPFSAESVGIVEEPETARRCAVKERDVQSGADRLAPGVKGLIEGNRGGIHRLLFPGDGFIGRGNGVARRIRKGQADAVSGKIRIGETAAEGAVGGHRHRAAGGGIGGVCQHIDSFGGSDHSPEVDGIAGKIFFSVRVDVHAVPGCIRHRGTNAHVAGCVARRDHRQDGGAPRGIDAAQAVFIGCTRSDGNGIRSILPRPQTPSGNPVVQVRVHIGTGHGARAVLQPKHQILPGGNGGHGQIRHLQDHLSVKGIGGQPRFSRCGEADQIASRLQHRQRHGELFLIGGTVRLAGQGVGAYFFQIIRGKYVLLAGQNELARLLLVFHQCGGGRRGIPIAVHGANRIVRRNGCVAVLRIYIIGKICALPGIHRDLTGMVSHGGFGFGCVIYRAEGGGGGSRRCPPRRQRHTGRQGHGVGLTLRQFLIGDHHQRPTVLVYFHPEVHRRCDRDVLRQIRRVVQYLIESELNARIGGHVRGPIRGKHTRHPGRILRLEHKGGGTQQGGAFRHSIGDAEAVEGIGLQRGAGTHGELRPLPRNLHIRQRRDAQIAGQFLSRSLPARADGEGAVRCDHASLGRIIGYGDLAQSFGDIRRSAVYTNRVIQGDNGHFFLLFGW